jgi:hypothetical protein
MTRLHLALISAYIFGKKKLENLNCYYFTTDLNPIENLGDQNST